MQALFLPYSLNTFCLFVIMSRKIFGEGLHLKSDSVYKDEICARRPRLRGCKNMLETTSFARSAHPGEWPGRIDALPLLLSEHQLARLLDRSVRTLQTKRYKGVGWIPYMKVGRAVMYRRDDVLAYYGIVARQAA
jgi:hypothetical protein